MIYDQRENTCNETIEPSGLELVFYKISNTKKLSTRKDTTKNYVVYYDYPI